MYIPHTPAEREEMLGAIGVGSLEELFQAVPAAHRFPGLRLPPALTEMEALAEMQELAYANSTTRELISFLGAGAYNHYIPAAVDSILRRGEFYTAYTPYQPELAQGTLQAIFDYQSLVAALTGMDVSNASHYDGATAVAEAVSMAYANFRGKRTGVVLSPGLHPHYRQTVRTYNHGLRTWSSAARISPWKADRRRSCRLSTPTPPWWSCSTPISSGASTITPPWLKPLTRLAHCLPSASTRLPWGCSNRPASSAPTSSPAKGQPLGIPLSYGGPYLGLFATRKEFVRKMAGRLVGETVDNRGQRAYVLTLTAREQHIRREKATSNICTNQGLIALASAVYMSLLGKQGLRQVAELCYHKAHYAAQQIDKVRGYKLWSSHTLLPRVRGALPHAGGRDQRAPARARRPGRLRSGPGLPRPGEPHAHRRYGDELKGGDRHAGTTVLKEARHD